MCAYICVYISSRFIPFEVLHCLSLGFPKSRCVGAVFDSSLHAQITVRRHPLDYKRAKLTGKIKAEMRKWAKESYSENAEAENVSENVREKRLVFLFWWRDAEEEYNIRAFRPHNYHTCICIVKKGAIVLFTGWEGESEREIRKSKFEMCENDEKETIRWAKFKEEHGAPLFSLWKKNTHKIAQHEYLIE